MPRKGQESEPLSPADRIVVLGLLALGYQQKRIAALMDCNQGRVSELHNGRYLRKKKVNGAGVKRKRGRPRKDAGK
jgi:hypothetical protein